MYKTHETHVIGEEGTMFGRVFLNTSVVVRLNGLNYKKKFFLFVQ